VDICNAHRDSVTPHRDREKPVIGGYCVSVDEEVLIVYFVLPVNGEMEYQG
jgi:hypothetical protein